jgi:hypothetical protein
MNKIREIAKKAIAHPLFFPLALLMVGIVAYGLMIPRLGFYWDDWESVYLYKLHNPAISFQYFGDRPFSALVYLALFPVAGMTPIVWQLIALILRWGGVLFIYYTMNMVWPERTQFNRWTAALFFVFPGFFQQPVALCNSRHFTTFFLFSISLFLTALALKKRRFFWLWMPLSVIFSIAQLFMMEYFVGLEIVRPLIIWTILQSRQEDKRIPFKTFLYWLPFMIGLGIYVWWRFFHLPTTFPGSDPNSPILLKNLFSSPVTALGQLLRQAYQDSTYLIVSVWGKAFSLDTYLAGSVIPWLSWLAGIITAFLFGWYVHGTSSVKESKNTGLVQMSILGGLVLTFGAAPVWSMGRQIVVGKWSDRFALAPMLGAVILVVCLVDWLIKTRSKANWLLAILLASSITMQIYNGNAYRTDWKVQRDIDWQLSWRIPSLKSGTALFGKGTLSDKISYQDEAYVVNLLFDKTPQINQNYGYFDIYHTGFVDYKPGIPVTQTVRSGQFSGNTSQAVVFDYNVRGGCVRVLDAIYVGDPGLSNSVADLGDISDVSNIVDGPALVPSRDIFGTEPSHSWCYYFEKADLARQMLDWKTVLQLKTAADAAGLKPNEGAEYLPFIVAYAQSGQWEQAYDLSLAASQISPPPGAALCNAWDHFSAISGGSDRDAYLAKAKSEFCSKSNP